MGTGTMLITISWKQLYSILASGRGDDGPSARGNRKHQRGYIKYSADSSVPC